MGYYTNFNLHFDTDQRTKEEIEKYIKHYADTEDKFLGIDLDATDYSNGEVKWYEHEEDMKKLSQTFPNVLFELFGFGEEDEDIWKKYFKRGKMQIADTTIVHEAFDENKLAS